MVNMAPLHKKPPHCTWMAWPIVLLMDFLKTIDPPTHAVLMHTSLSSRPVQNARRALLIPPSPPFLYFPKNAKVFLRDEGSGGTKVHSRTRRLEVNQSGRIPGVTMPTSVGKGHPLS